MIKFMAVLNISLNKIFKILENLSLNLILQAALYLIKCPEIVDKSSLLTVNVSVSIKLPLHKL